MQMKDIVEISNNPQPLIDSENNILNHDQIVKDISNEHLVHTNHIMVSISVLCGILALFTGGVSLIGILIAYLYKCNWDQKKQKVLKGEYILKCEGCSGKRDNDTYSDTTSSIKYKIFFNDGCYFKFRDNSDLYKSINVGDLCYVIYLRGSSNIAYAYKKSDWILGEDIKKFVVI